MSAKHYAAGPELDTAYRGTRDEWAGLLGSSHAQLRGMRQIVIALVVVLGIAFGAMFAIAKRPVLVYGVQTDGIGQVSVLGPFQQEVKPSDANIRFYLGQFVETVRRATADPPFTQRGREASYWYATTRGQNILSHYYESAGSPSALAKQGTVSVEVTSKLKITTGTWQVDWIERRRDLQGNPGPETTWRGSFRIRMRPPKDGETLERNPLGLYVDEFNWVKLKG